MELLASNRTSPIDPYYEHWLKLRPEGVGCTLVEYRVLYSIAHNLQPRNVLEIGCGSGASSVALLLGSGDRTSLHRVTIHPEQADDVVDPIFSPQISTWAMTSDAFFAEIKPAVGTYDLIFIDGDHSQEVVERDIRQSLRVLAQDGVIVLHDTKPTCLGDIGALARRLAAETGYQYDELPTDGNGLGVILVLDPTPVRRLELGAGPFPQAGYDTLDGEDWRPAYQNDVRPETALVHNVELAVPWPIPDNTYDEILSIHMLEHIHRDRVAWFFQEALRVLKPGGTFRIHVPNGPVIAQTYLDKPNRREGLQICIYGLSGFQEAHQALYDVGLLGNAFIHNGFTNVRDVTHAFTDRHDEGWEPLFEHRGRMSLKVMGTKPLAK